MQKLIRTCGFERCEICSTMDCVRIIYVLRSMYDIGIGVNCAIAPFIVSSSNNMQQQQKNNKDVCVLTKCDCPSMDCVCHA